MNEHALVLGVLLGAVGAGYLMYARRTRRVVPLCVGIGLIGMPWVIENPWLLLITGVGLLAVSYYVRG